MKSILFVCTGNTCRSPLAEGLFRQMAEQAGIDVKVQSAGVSALNNMPVAEHTMQILTEKGIQEPMYSSSLSEEAVSEADLVLTMTMNHKKHIVELLPQAVDKVFTLKEYVEDDPAVHQIVSEWEKLHSELQVKQALSQEITEEEHLRLSELERSMPDYDVLDPIGGSLSDYRQCARDIEHSLQKLITRLKENNAR